MGLIVFSSILFLLIGIYIAYLFGKAAEDKGYYGTKYYVVPYFFGIFGMLWIIALPDNTLREAIQYSSMGRQEQQKKEVVSNELPEL